MGFMKPKKPKSPRRIKTPTEKNSAGKLDASHDRRLAAADKYGGRASTMLTKGGVQGDDSTNSGIVTKKVLGSR